MPPVDLEPSGGSEPWSGSTFASRPASLGKSSGRNSCLTQNEDQAVIFPCPELNLNLPEEDGWMVFFGGVGVGEREGNGEGLVCKASM